MILNATRIGSRRRNLAERTTRAAAGSSATLTALFPATAVTGDLLVVWTAADAAHSSTSAPVGWTQLDYSAFTTIFGRVCVKIATSADITTGSLAFGLASSAAWVYCVAAVPNVSDIAKVTLLWSGGQTNPGATTRTSTAYAAAISNLLIHAGAIAGTGTVQPDRGSAKQSSSGVAPSYKFSTEQIAATITSRTTTFTNAANTGDYSCVVKVAT